jgi:hypothetical protein
MQLKSTYVLLVLWLAGCSTASAPIFSATAPNVPRGGVRASQLALHEAAAEYLYVGAQCASSNANVTIIPLPLTANPAETIVPLPSYVGYCADAIAVGEGSAFIGTPQGCEQAYILPLTPSSQPAYQLGSCTSSQGVTFSDNGDLFVANDDHTRIDVYKPPISQNSLPAFSFGSPPVVQYERSLAFDKHSNLFTANGNVLVYQPPFNSNSVPAAAITLPNNDSCTAVALDTNGNLYAAGALRNVVYVYQPPFTNSSKPTITIGGQQSGIDFPGGLALDVDGKLYVANELGGSLLEFTPPFSSNSVPAVTVSGLGQMYSLKIVP